jgi:hypothetical protein
MAPASAPANRRGRPDAATAGTAGERRWRHALSPPRGGRAGPDARAGARGGTPGARPRSGPLDHLLRPPPGGRNRADDFRWSERAYNAALAKYHTMGHHLVVLGDGDELWQERPGAIIEAYQHTLELEARFHQAGRFHRVWGNHDDAWSADFLVRHYLQPVYGEPRCGCASTGDPGDGRRGGAGHPPAGARAPGDRGERALVAAGPPPGALRVAEHPARDRLRLEHAGHRLAAARPAQRRALLLGPPAAGAGPDRRPHPPPRLQVALARGRGAGGAAGGRAQARRLAGRPGAARRRSGTWRPSWSGCAPGRTSGRGPRGRRRWTCRATSTPGAAPSATATSPASRSPRGRSAWCAGPTTASPGLKRPRAKVLARSFRFREVTSRGATEP